MKKHVLLYTSPAIGGVLELNHSILSALAELNYQLTYVQDVPDDLIQLFGAEKINQMRQNAENSVNQQNLGIQHHFWLEAGNDTDASKIFSEVQPDFIIFSNGAPIANFLAKRVAIQRKIPFIVIENLVHPGEAPKNWHPHLDELKQHYLQAESVIAVSENNLNLLHKYFQLPSDKGQVIYNGRPSKYFEAPNQLVRERLRQELQIPSDAVVCFTAARLDIIKGYQYQLGAISRLMNHDEVWSKLYFIWAGSGSLETHFKQTVKQIAATERVKFLGQISNVDCWLDASDIFILPSESEGMPLAIIEAMAKGLPVIASAVSGIPEELGDTGKLLTNPLFDSQATIQELTDTIINWTRNDKLRRAIGEACRQRAISVFAEARMIKEYIQVVEKSLLRVG